MFDLASFSYAIVAFVANYVVHSTLLLTACWLLVTLSRTRSHFLADRMWKLAAVLGIVTAFTQVIVGPNPLLRALIPSDGPVAVIDASRGSHPQVESNASFEVEVVGSDVMPALNHEAGNSQLVMSMSISTLSDDGRDILPAITVGYAQDQILVVSGEASSSARLGMPVDRVLGLVDGGGDSQSRLGESLVVERRPVEGRIVHILDPMTLVARGGEVMESATH